MKRQLLDWKSIRQSIQNLPTSNRLFQACLDDIVLAEEQESGRVVFKLLVPSKVHKSRALKFLKEISGEISKKCSEPFRLEIIVNKEMAPPSPVAQEKTLTTPFSAPKKAAPPPIPKSTKYTFDSFVVGPSNQLAYGTSRQLAEKPFDGTSLFIYGTNGVGKTHLIYAVAHSIASQFPQIKVRHISGESFMRECVYHIQRKNMDLFKKKYREETDVLLIDDIHSLKGDHVQEEFFHTLESLYKRKCSIMFASDRHPEELGQLDARLKTRFTWGQCLDILPPEFETKFSILKNKAKQEHFLLSDDVLSYLVEISPHSARELEGVFSNLKAFSDFVHNGTLPDLEVIKRFFEKNKRRHLPKEEDISNQVCDHFQITKKELKSSKRLESLVIARHAYSYLMSKYLKYSLSNIGYLLGGRGHSTVINSIRRAEKLIESDILFKKKINSIKNTLYLS